MRAFQNQILRVGFLTTLVSLAAGSNVLAQAPRLQVVLTRITCDHTTEAGHDEIYYICGGVNGAGQPTSRRGPHAKDGADADRQTAWDLNDRGDKQDRRLNAVIHEEALAEGQTASLNFVWMESDGTDIGSILQLAGKLAGQAVQDPRGRILTNVSATLFGLLPKNNDDVLGSFHLRVKNDHGTPVIETTPGEYTTVQDALNNGTFSYRFQHDDGNYKACFHVRLVR